MDKRDCLPLTTKDETTLNLKTLTPQNFKGGLKNPWRSDDAILHHVAAPCIYMCHFCIDKAVPYPNRCRLFYFFSRNYVFMSSLNYVELLI